MTKLGLNGGAVSSALGAGAVAAAGVSVVAGGVATGSSAATHGNDSNSATHADAMGLILLIRFISIPSPWRGRRAARSLFGGARANNGQFGGGGEQRPRGRRCRR